MLAGSFNGLLVGVVRIQPIVATLGLFIAGRGLALMIADGRLTEIFDPTIRSFGTKQLIGGLQPGVLIALGLTVIVGIVVRFTVFGKRLVAIGGSPGRRPDGRPSGAPHADHRLRALGALAAVAGVLATARSGASDPSFVGLLIELSAITAVVVGGTPLAGGEIRVNKTTNEVQRQQHHRRLSGGLDFRMGLGTASTLSAAINPDFGQVEQDPAVLNLSVFETFFPEKRTFFTEDSRVLVPNYPQVPMFYSRRIGQRPNRFAVADDETVLERPDATTILGATKVTGKAHGWTYGGLTALTDREYALVQTGSGERTERLIEPYTSYNVGRVQKDLFSGSSNIGGLGTAVIREGDVDAYTGSVDYSLRWSQNKYTWNGQWSGTRSGVQRRDEERLRRGHELQLQQQAPQRLRSLRLLQQHFQEQRSRVLLQSQQQAVDLRRRESRPARSGQGLAQSQLEHQCFDGLQRRQPEARSRASSVVLTASS